MNAAIAGHGITLGPEDVLKTEVERGSLVQVLAGFSGPARPMHILVPAGRRRTTKIKCFVDALRAALGPR